VAVVELEINDENVGFSVCGIFSFVISRPPTAGHIPDSETFTVAEISPGGMELSRPFSVKTCCSLFDNDVMTAFSAAASELAEISVLERTDMLRPSSVMSTSSRSPVYGLTMRRAPPNSSSKLLSSTSVFSVGAELLPAAVVLLPSANAAVMGKIRVGAKCALLSAISVKPDTGMTGS